MNKPNPPPIPLFCKDNKEDVSRIHFTEIDVSLVPD